MNARPPERDDLDALLDPLLQFAKDTLIKPGEFLPFGNVMRTDGDTELVAGYTRSEQPPSQELIELMVAGMRSRATAGEIRAAGICYDVRLRAKDGSPTDAVAVSLEHQAGDTVHVFMPYSKGRFTSFRFGDLTAGPGERRIFGPR